MTSHDPERAQAEAPASGEPMAGTPSAHTPNGSGEAFKPNAAELIGNAVGRKVADAILAALPQALAQVLSQVPVNAQLLQWFKCSACVTARIQWCAVHQDDLKTAEAQMIAVLGQLPEGDPRRGQVNVLMFLPPELQSQPGVTPPGSRACPNVLDGAVMMGGAVYCPDHVPGVSAAGGRKEFLIASAPLSPAMLAEVMGQGQAA